jgi:hypothetical protein
VSGPGSLGPRQVMWSVVRGIWVAQPQRPSLSGWLGQRTVRLVIAGSFCVLAVCLPFLWGASVWKAAWLGGHGRPCL